MSSFVIVSFLSIGVAFLAILLIAGVLAWMDKAETSFPDWVVTTLEAVGPAVIFLLVGTALTFAIMHSFFGG